MAYLKYHDVPLLWDQGGQSRRFQDMYHPLNEVLPYIAESIYRQDGKEGPVGQSHVGLSMPNYPPPHPIRLNELYWPTGASRWGRAFFLIDTDGRNLVNTRLESWNYLHCHTGDEFPLLKVAMHALPPVPVSAYLTGTAYLGLWILPLVDSRYFWQFVSVDDLGSDHDSLETWQDLLEWINGWLIGDIKDYPTIPDVYGKPDPDECGRRFRNIAHLLDAVAHSIGCRIVFQHDNTWECLDWDWSQAYYNDNFSNKQRQSTEENKDKKFALYMTAGGDYSDALYLPMAVNVQFPKSIHRMLQRLKRVYSVYTTMNDALPDARHRKIDRAYKHIHTTYWASYTGTECDQLVDCSDPKPTNSAECDALALRLSQDFYVGAGIAYDYTYAGVRDWLFSGYDDCAIYYLGAECEPHIYSRTDTVPLSAEATGGQPPLVAQHQRRVMTRIRSMPCNFGTEDMLHQTKEDDEQIIFRPLGLDYIIGKTTSAIAGRSGDHVSFAEVPVYYIDHSDNLVAFKTDDGTQEKHDVYNLDLVSVPTDEWITLHKELLSGKKIAQTLGNNFMIGVVVDADIDPHQTGKVEKHNEEWVATGVQYNVLNPHSVTLEVGLKVRWGRYPGWTSLVVEPWDFTDCA